MIQPYYEEPGITIYNSDCREILPHLPKVDLLLTDPQYGISVDNVKRSAPVNRHGPDPRLCVIGV